MSFSGYEEAEHSAVLATIRKTIEREGLLGAPGTGAGERVLVAISGGPDSVALLHALLAIAPERGVLLEAATVDHGLRPEAAAEAAAVASRCQAIGIRCAVLRVDVSAARQGHVSLQDAARRVRLAALAAAARERGCRWVALGHTADDQAETVLFRIVRGTGLRGLRGIPYARGPFVRPLLDVRRRQVLRFLGQRALPFVEDPSNRDRRFTRSRVRHEWLPFLQRENPQVVEALLELGREAQRVLPASPPAGAGPLPPMGRRAAAKVAELAAEGRGTRYVHFEGGTAEVAYGQVLVRAGHPPRQASAPPAPERRVEIPGPGQYLWKGAGGVSLEIDVQARDAMDAVARGPAHAESAGPGAAAAGFAWECLGQGLHLRAVRPGDRMRPRGGIGSRKLQDLLVDAKVPRGRRGDLPVLCTSAGTILFVPGLRPSEVGRPGPGAPRWIEIRVFCHDTSKPEDGTVG
jgi:tRNA(Ile)-lysidine synthase